MQGLRNDMTDTKYESTGVHFIGQACAGESKEFPDSMPYKVVSRLEFHKEMASRYFATYSEALAFAQTLDTFPSRWSLDHPDNVKKV
jgi:hypothetical protein